MCMHVVYIPEWIVWGPSIDSNTLCAYWSNRCHLFTIHIDVDAHYLLLNIHKMFNSRYILIIIHTHTHARSYIYIYIYIYIIL